MRAHYPRDISGKPRPIFIASPTEVFVFNPISGEAPISTYSSTGGSRATPPSHRDTSRLPDNGQYDERIPGHLAPIVRTTLDPEALCQLDTGNSSLRHAMDMLQSLESWKDHMIVPFEQIPNFFARGTSRRMLKHRARLLYYQVVRDVRQQDIRVVTNFFCVEKKDSTLRLVVDGRKVNVLMERPPRMDLPGLHEVIDYVLSNDYALQVDGTSYFYQFGISDEVGTMFCANLSAERGQFTPVAMTRMPMGWSYAPYIAQLTSNTLLRAADGRILGLAWIDNFFFAGKTKEEVLANFKEFRDRCDSCNVRIDEREPKPEPVLSALGLHFDLRSKELSLDPTWVAKRNFSLAAEMTPRHLYEITGNGIWHDYAKRIPLCHREACIDVVRRIASLIHNTNAWDEPVSFSPSELLALQDWITAVKTNTPVLWRPRSPPELDLWSDASDMEWAALWFHNEAIAAGEQGTFGETLMKQHIFLKEAFAADKVLSATRGIPRAINIDNKPLVQCIQRGFSTNRFVNALIKTWDLDNINARWVSTLVQKADPYTRGEKFHPHLPKLASISLRRPQGAHTHTTSF